MSKKILLLTAGYGTGHITASRSIGEEIHRIKPQEVEVKTYDFINTQGFINAGRTFQKLYNWSMEKPCVWDTFFDWTNSRAATYYFKTVFPLFYKKVHVLFDSENPDLCMVTHPYWNFLINDHNRQHAKRVRYFCFVTDAIEIHQTWIDPDADMYFVCDDATAGIIERRGIRKEKIVVTGFPVSTRLGEPMDRKKFLDEFGLSDKPTLLFVLGLGDVGRFLEIIDSISKLRELNFQIIVITGKYRDAQDVLQRKRYDVPTKIVGWTDRMADFLRASDLVVSKGGGAIVMETLAAGKPIVIPVFTPGQERGNAKLIESNNFGFVRTDRNEAIEVVRGLLKYPERLSALKDNIKRFSKPFAARDIAGIVCANINE